MSAGRSATLPARAKVAALNSRQAVLSPPIMLGPFPLLHHVCDPLHADDVLTVHREDGMVGCPVVQRNTLVVRKPLVLPAALLLKGLHDLGHEAR